MEGWGRKSDSGFLMNTSAPAAFVGSGAGPSPISLPGLASKHFYLPLFVLRLEPIAFGRATFISPVTICYDGNIDMAFATFATII